MASPCVSARSRLGLDGVADGVARFKHGAQPGFAWIRADDPRLDADAAAHDVGQQLGVARHDAGGFALEQLEQLGSPMIAVFTTSDSALR
jgi:hypothetical protein